MYSFFCGMKMHSIKKDWPLIHWQRLKDPLKLESMSYRTRLNTRHLPSNSQYNLLLTVGVDISFTVFHANHDLWSWKKLYLPSGISSFAVIWFSLVHKPLEWCQKTHRIFYISPRTVPIFDLPQHVSWRVYRNIFPRGVSRSMERTGG